VGLEKIFNSQNSTKVEEKSPDFFSIYLTSNQIWLNLPVDDGSFSLCCLHISQTKWTSAFGEDFQSPEFDHN
jgi:hypothetical protein